MEEADDKQELNKYLCAGYKFYKGEAQGGRERGRKRKREKEVRKKGRMGFLTPHTPKFIKLL